MEAKEVDSPNPILLVEPFYGGSHKQLLDVLYKEFEGCDMHTMPAKKWHWRARTAALYLAQNIPYNHHYRSADLHIYTIPHK